MPNLQTQPVPLIEDQDGTIRIVGSRVTLESIVHEFDEGATAEQIHEDFPSVALADIYAVIAYYLQNTSSVEEYVRRRRDQAAQLRAEIESNQDSGAIRERLQGRGRKSKQ